MKATTLPPPSGGNNVHILLCSSLLLAFFALTTHATSVGTIIPQQGSKEADLISKLPGQPTVDFCQYSGYVTVNKESERAYFYYFVESANATIKASGPLVLWLSGGPGCSSMAAAMLEQGPFRVNSDGKTLVENAYAWNTVANVLFLESPAGVGYSYTNTSSDLNALNDDFVAKDNLNFLLNWLERFPEYKGRSLFLTGEHYAGHYVPQLADLILQNNVKAVKLQGIALGNPRLDYENYARAQFQYLWDHDLISRNDWETIQKTCDFTAPAAGKPINDCASAWNLKSLDTVFKKMDRYNIYASLCRDTDTITNTMIYRDIDPCMSKYVTRYLNTPEVQSALHANVTKLSYPWGQCSNISNYRSSEGLNMVPILQKLLTNKIRILIYSGDLDSVASFTGTRKVLDKLNITPDALFGPWLAENDQVGGFGITYEEGLTFITVRAAGHHVPMWQPQRALIMIKCFVNNEKLPSVFVRDEANMTDEDLERVFGSQTPDTAAAPN